MLRKSILRGVAGLVAVGVFASACSSGGDTGESESAPGRSTVEGVIPLEPPDILPYTSSHAGKLPVLDAVSMRILLTDGEGEPFSYALDSWDVSDDGHTVTLGIRPDVEWSDGTPMTSADVVMSLTQYLDPSLTVWSVNFSGEVVGQSAFGEGEADSIVGLSAPDDHTVEVELVEPNGVTWLANLAQTFAIVLPAHILGDVPHDELSDHEYFNSYPVTLGPYKLVEWSPAQYFEFERSDSWSLGEAGFDRVFVKFVTADVQLAQLEAQESQIISISPADVERIESIDGTEIQSRLDPRARLWVLGYNEPLLDRRVRQAMAYAIDREGICEAVLNGYCSVPLENTIVESWARPEGLTQYNYDPDRARELLDEAGWDPSTELIFLNSSPPDTDISEAITIAQGNMADVGINWKIENVDIPALTDRVENAPDSYHGLSGITLPEGHDPSFMRSTYSCDFQFPNGNNLGYYCNEELDELLSSGQVEGDPDKRAEIYQDAVQILNEELPVIQLIQPEGLLAHDSRLKGVEATSAIFGAYWNIGEWTWEE